MLSGFVLALPFLGHHNFSYLKLIIKRICRIYIPYLVIITLAIIARFTFYTATVRDFGTMPTVTLQMIVQHHLFLGEFNYKAFDGPTWSLVDEMQISLIFPLVMIAIVRLKWLVNILIIAFGMSVYAYYLHQW